MKMRIGFHNRLIPALIVAALAGAIGAAPVMAADADLDRLYERLAAAEDAGEAGRIAAEITIVREKSGSPALDLLYRRGSRALQEGDVEAAIDHLDALIDQAPAFGAARDARAAGHYQRGAIGPALADLAVALIEEPRDFDALRGLAAILEETDQAERALAVYLMVADIHPWLAEVDDAIKRLRRTLEGQEI